MYILDTDHLSHIQMNGQKGKQILKRLAVLENVYVAVTVITYQEQVIGRLGAISSSKTLDRQVLAYQGLQQLSTDYKSIDLVPFCHQAAQEYQDLRKAYPRLGSNDLKIAAIALVNKAIVLTCNTKDFGKIARLQIEDWSIEN